MESDIPAVVKAEPLELRQKELQSETAEHSTELPGQALQPEEVVVKIEPLDLVYDDHEEHIRINEENVPQSPSFDKISIKLEPYLEIASQNESRTDNNSQYDTPNKQKTNKKKNNKESRKKLSKNESNSIKDGLYPCKSCEHVFASAGSLYRHSRVHNTSEHICDICQQSFKKKTHLVKHKAHNCNFNDSLTCNVCQKRFLLQCRLQSHLKRHTDETPFECDVCNMKFKWKSTLIRHMLLHTNEKPFSCKFCDKKFTHAGLIKAHLRKHTGEQPYECPICLKKFSHKHNMDRHQLNHNKVKQTICQICFKEFAKESRLKYHMRVHWEDKYPFKCEVCPKTFSNRQNIMRHYRKKHPNAKYEPNMTDASIATEQWMKTKHVCSVEDDCILPDA